MLNSSNYKFSRIITDLSNGLPIIIKDDKKKSLIIAIDSNNQDILSYITRNNLENSDLKTDKISLLLTNKRINYLIKSSGNKIPNHDLLSFKNIMISDFDHKSRVNLEIINAISGMDQQKSADLAKLIDNDTINIIKNIKKSTDITESFNQCLLSLAKIGEILPAFIHSDDINTIIHIKDLLGDIPIQEIDIENVSAYHDHAIISQICSAPLILEDSTNKAIKANIHVFRSHLKEHYAIVLLPQSYSNDDPNLESDCNHKLDHYNYRTTILNPLVRLHSSCFTGDVLRSIKCDCYSQLHKALDIISQDNQGGILLYLNQEGRSIGLSNKLRTYYLQEYETLDTVEANQAIGLNDDARDFKIAAQMLIALGINQIKLLSNNPDKSLILKNHGIKISENIVHIAATNDEAKNYLKTKMLKLGHTNFNELFKI